MTRHSRLYSHDPRHFQFERRSNLPKGYFSEPRNVDVVVLAVVLALGAVVGALVYLGVIE